MPPVARAAFSRSGDLGVRAIRDLMSASATRRRRDRSAPVLVERADAGDTPAAASGQLQAGGSPRTGTADACWTSSSTTPPPIVSSSEPPDAAGDSVSVGERVDRIGVGDSAAIVGRTVVLAGLAERAVVLADIGADFLMRGSTAAECAGVVRTGSQSELASIAGPGQPREAGPRHSWRSGPTHQLGRR